MGSAFAKIEKTPCVPNTPDDEQELYNQIKQRASELKVITKMEHWRDTIDILDKIGRDRPESQFFLLELEPNKARISTFLKGEEAKAMQEYADTEKRISGMKDKDIVLVGADYKDLKKAYPNYFADTTEFLKNLKKYLGEEQKKITDRF